MRKNKVDPSRQEFTNSRERILNELADLEWHHWKELQKFGVQFSSRISELRSMGYKVQTRRDKDDPGNWYRLASLDRGEPKPVRVRVFFDYTDARKLLRGVLTRGAKSAIADAVAAYNNKFGGET